jgi:2,5-diamino-6-(ribosylamino)-4(3H)-pyrimidinone 5'-phosphate reductase
MIRPRVSINLAVSADGKISPADRRPSAWTSARDKARLLDLRRDCDALLVGRGTWETDRMTMTAPANPVPPLRCIVSASGEIDPAHPIFRTPGGAIHLLVTGDEPAEIPAGVRDSITVHRQSLAAFLETLAVRLGVSLLHCEGGGQLIHALAALDAIDDFHLTLAGHTLFGGRDSPTATGVPGDFLPSSRDYELAEFDPQPDTGECFLTYRRKRPQ